MRPSFFIFLGYLTLSPAFADAEKAALFSSKIELNEYRLQRIVHRQAGDGILPHNQHLLNVNLPRYLQYEAMPQNLTDLELSAELDRIEGLRVITHDKDFRAIVLHGIEKPTRRPVYLRFDRRVSEYHQAALYQAMAMDSRTFVPLIAVGALKSLGQFVWNTTGEAIPDAAVLCANYPFLGGAAVLYQPKSWVFALPRSIIGAVVLELFGLQRLESSVAQAGQAVWEHESGLLTSENLMDLGDSSVGFAAAFTVVGYGAAKVGGRVGSVLNVASQGNTFGLPAFALAEGGSIGMTLVPAMELRLAGAFVRVVPIAGPAFEGVNVVYKKGDENPFKDGNAEWLIHEIRFGGHGDTRLVAKYVRQKRKGPKDTEPKSASLTEEEIREMTPTQRFEAAEYARQLRRQRLWSGGLSHEYLRYYLADLQRTLWRRELNIVEMEAELLRNLNAAGQHYRKLRRIQASLNKTQLKVVHLYENFMERLARFRAAASGSTPP